VKYSINSYGGEWTSLTANGLDLLLKVDYNSAIKVVAVEVVAVEVVAVEVVAVEVEVGTGCR
jgi:hypothetical protein